MLLSTRKRRRCSGKSSCGDPVSVSLAVKALVLVRPKWLLGETSAAPSQCPPPSRSPGLTHTTPGSGLSLNVQTAILHITCSEVCPMTTALQDEWHSGWMGSGLGTVFIFHSVPVTLGTTGPGISVVYSTVLYTTAGSWLGYTCSHPFLSSFSGLVIYTRPAQRIPPPLVSSSPCCQKSVGTLAEGELTLVPYFQNKPQLGLSLAHRHLSAPPPPLGWDALPTYRRPVETLSTLFSCDPCHGTLLAARACSTFQTAGQACIRDLRLSTYRRSEPVPTAPLAIQG